MLCDTIYYPIIIIIKSGRNGRKTIPGLTSSHRAIIESIDVGSRLHYMGRNLQVHRYTGLMLRNNRIYKYNTMAPQPEIKGVFKNAHIILTIECQFLRMTTRRGTDNVSRYTLYDIRTDIDEKKSLFPIFVG